MMAEGILPPRREPSGRRQRTTAEMQTEQARRMADAETATVRHQPHRRGDASRLAESPIGRFVRDYALPVECYFAALKYARLRGLWGAHWGAQRRESHAPKHGSGEVDDEMIRGWKADIVEMERAMVDGGGEDGKTAVVAMAYDGVDIVVFNRLRAMAALRALAIATGHLEPPKTPEPPRDAGA